MLALLAPLLPLLAILIIVVAFGYGFTLVRMMSIRVRRQRQISWITPNEVRPDVFETLERHGQRLEALGFARVGALREDDLLDGVDEPVWSLLHRSADGLTHARISLAESPMRVQPVDLTFLSFVSRRADDPVLVETVAWRIHRIPDDVPGHDVADARTLDWAEHAAFHASRLAERREAGAEALTLDGESFVAALALFRRRVRSFELGCRRFVTRTDGTLRYSCRFAFDTIMRVNRGEGARLRAIASTERAEGAEVAEAARRDLTPDLAAHRRRQAVEASKPQSRPARKAIVFLASMLIYLVLFSLRFSLETVLLLVLAVVIHEAGHALAMRAFGYRDLQIVFVPFLGAVARGRKDHVPPLQEIVVLLAGPLPGILLGTWLMTSGLADRDPTAYAFANALLILNYINMLPIVPLDGGKLMSILLFDRFPIVQFAFSACSALAIVAFGVSVGEWVIAGVGLILVFAAPRQLIQARTFSRLRRALGRAGQVAIDPLRTIYAELQDPRFDRWSSEARFQFVNGVRERLARQLAGGTLIVASLGVYVATWVVPVDALLEHHIAREAATGVEAVAEVTQAPRVQLLREPGSSPSTDRVAIVRRREDALAAR